MPEYKILIDEYLKETKAVNGSANTHAEEQTENVEVPFTKDGDITKVKCTINGLPLYFVFDTGAADVTMSTGEIVVLAHLAGQFFQFGVGHGLTAAVGDQHPDQSHGTAQQGGDDCVIR